MGNGLSLGQAWCRVRVRKGVFCEVHVANALNAWVAGEGRWNEAAGKQNPRLITKNPVDEGGKRRQSRGNQWARGRRGGA